MRIYFWIAILSLAVRGAAQTSPGTPTTILDFGVTTVALPETGVVIGSDGVLYGTASFPPGYAVYSLTPPTQPGGSWTYSTLYQTQGTERSQTLTSSPGLAIDSNGVLYGATNRIVDTACTSQTCGWNLLFDSSGLDWGRMDRDHALHFHRRNRWHRSAGGCDHWQRWSSVWHRVRRRGPWFGVFADAAGISWRNLDLHNAA